MLFWVRVRFVLVCLGTLALCVHKHQRAVAVVRAFFLEPGPAINLGLLRIYVFWMLFQEARISQAAWYTSLDPGFIKLPRGWAWLGDFIPLSPELVRGGEIAMMISCGFATLGLLTRVSTLVGALLALFVFAVPNFYFKINHGLHVPVLTAFVIASAPSGHALSLDALFRRLRGGGSYGESLAYSLPVRFTWLLMGTMYLFPGLWKLWETGDLWIDGIKLKVELFEKWGQMPEYYPSFRIDHYPWLLAFFGTMTLVVEIGFLPAMFHRVTRVLAGIAAMGFHIGVGYTMNIWFDIWFPLLVLLDFPKLRLPGVSQLVSRVKLAVARLPESVRSQLLPPDTPDRPSLGTSTAATTVVGSILVFSMFVAGLAPIDSWPIAVYPRFDSRDSSPSSRSYALQFGVRNSKGVERELPSAFQKLADDTAAFRIARATLRLKGKAKNQAALDRHLELLKRLVRENFGPLEPGSQLLIYRSDFEIEPEERKRQRPRRRLVLETDL